MENFELNDERFLHRASPVQMSRKDPIIAIRWPEAGGLRARKVVSRSRARPTGKYPSWKMGRMIQWESPSELNAIRLLDADPIVTSFSEQPLVIDYEMDGQVRRHYPDLLVRRGRAAELWEIKASADKLDAEIQRRTTLLTNSLGAHGFNYRMVLGAELSHGPHLGNALAVLRYGRPEIPPVDRERTRLIFSRAEVVTWEQVIAGVLGSRGRQMVCRLILEGIVGFDRQAALAMQTPLHWIDNHYPRGRS